MISNTSTELLRAFARFHPDGRPVSRNTAHLMQFWQEQQEQEQAAAAKPLDTGNTTGPVIRGWLRRVLSPRRVRTNG